MLTIFVVEDEENISHLIRQYLLREGYQIETFSSVEDTYQRMMVKVPDMFILDIGLPGKDGLAFCQEIRGRMNLPIIFISARGEEIDRILGLELGGDDYLAKPFSPRELVARVRSVFRRFSSVPAGDEIFTAGNIQVCPQDRRVTIGEQGVMLTPKEYELLLLLIQHPKRTFSRQELMDRIWGYDHIGDIRAVDSLVKRLRQKLSAKGTENNVMTVWGHGYKLDA